MSVKAQVDFYLLTQADESSKLQYACRLLQKAYLSQHKCYVCASNESQLSALDEMLWTFSDTSFIPHRCYQAATPAWHDYPVQLGLQVCQDEAVTLVLNLHATQIPAIDKVSRVLELVGADEQDKHSARKRFAYYRKLRIEPNTHKL